MEEGVTVCGLSSPCSYRRLFLVLLLLGLATLSVFAQTQTNLPQSSETQSNTGSPPTSESQSLDQLLTELENEANAQAEDLKNLLGQLTELQTETSELSILLGLSEQQFKSLQETMMSEREQSRLILQAAIENGVRAESSRDLWKYSTICAGVLAVAGWIAFAVSAAF